MRVETTALLVLCFLFPPTITAVQLKAGSPESQLFDQITAETNADLKLGLIDSFTKQYPASKVLARIYLQAIEVYRQKGDRAKINEMGEKVLQLDDSNLNAMMLLARNYAIESKNLDRAIELAQRAVDQTVKLRGEPLPVGYTATQWKDYLRSNEDSAGQILDYVKAMKARSDSIAKASLSKASNTPPAAANDAPAR
jgi:tetratricopeptide (TPR) repeat protein